MTDSGNGQPRWGNKGRDRKAIAIRDTLLLVHGPGVDAGTWLDVGCGSGGIAAELADHAANVIGIDPQPWPAWGEAMAVHPNLRLVADTFDGSRLPLPEASVDVAVCNQVYEHVVTPSQLVRNLYRVMAPGGVCYFAGPNLLWPIEPHVYWPFVHWLPRSWAQALMRALGSRHADELDAYSAHCGTMRRWFRESGFEVRWALRERITAELMGRRSPRMARIIARSPAKAFALLEIFSPGFIYVLRKPGTEGGDRG